MITIDYFSDLLCVWAYGGQVRLDELQREFGEQILVRQRFVTLFGDTATRIGEGWRDKGGFDGFGRHMHEVCEQWPHTRLHGDVWTRCRPSSCVTAHAFVKAVAACLGGDDDAAQTRDAGTVVDALIADLRRAFFEQGLDISRLDVLLEHIPDGVSADAVRQRIDDGGAYAALHRDSELMKTYGVLGSPTYVFNEGRQLLYGNVGYRIIESNVRELLARPPEGGEPSWC